MISKRELLGAGSVALAVTLLPRAANATQYIVQVPIGFGRGGSPVVTLTIDGAGPYRFVIDTGSGEALIRESVAKDLKLPTNGVISSMSLKGKDRDYIYKASNVVLDGLFTLPSVDFIGLEKLPHSQVDGVLPASILTFLPTELDFTAAMVRFHINGAPMDLKGAAKLDAFYQADSDRSAQKVYVNLTLDGKKLVCLLDTGSSVGLFLSGAYVERNRLWNKYPDARQNAAAGANGQTVKTRVAKINNLDLGPVHFDEVWATLADPGDTDTLLDIGIDGIIGVPVLRQFTVIFGADKEVYLRPNERFTPKAGPAPVAGPLDASKPSVPFLYGDDRRIVVPARYGTKPPFGLVVSTGETTSRIGAPLAAQIDLPSLPGGGYDGSVLMLNGGLHPQHLVLTGETLSSGQHYGGELGLDFLTGMTSRLDFDANLITFFPGNDADLGGYARVTLAAAPVEGDTRIYVRVTVAGQTYLCRLDTGYQMFLFLPPETVKKRDLWDKLDKAQDRQMMNNGVTFKTRFAGVDGFDLDAIHLARAAITMADPASPADPDHAGIDAVLGMGFIHRCNWMFVKGEVYAKANGFFTAG